MSQGQFYATTALVTVGAIGGAYCAYRLYQDQKPKLPEEWRKVGVLKSVYVYPIKSCGPVMLNTAEVSILGLRDAWLRDRFLMVVDENNKFISARAYPELLTVQPTVRSAVLTLKHDDMEPLHVNLAEVVALQKPKTGYVWGVPVPILDCGWEASEWFSRLLDKSAVNFRLAYYASQKCRTLRPSTNKFYKFTKNDTGALPDEVPFNLINEASVEDLNTRITDCRVSERNFRPNFVVSGGVAYDEDNWKFVKIGDNVFEIIKPCTRCIMTTIDPETGVKYSKPEPLETLKRYRQIEDPVVRRSAGNSPRMGLQMALRTEPGGVVSLNDAVYVA